jgi:UDP-2,3-diacylglucosamine hydrolase
MDRTLRRIFLSDLHLQSAETRVFSAFVNLLQRESQRANEIYLLGDLVEMWVGDDDDSHLALTLQAVLKLASQQTQIYFQHGNRDFLFGDDFCQSSGATWLPDPFLLDDHILLSHGDGFCTDDHAYQEVRSLLRSKAWQADILQKPLTERQSMGRQMREQSKQTNSNKSTQIMDVNGATVGQTMQIHGADLLIHGHTHRPGDYPRRGQDAYRRIVLGDWHDCGWLCRQENDAFALECFSLNRYSAGTPL